MEVASKAPLIRSQRFLLVILSFTGTLVVLTSRINLSVAIVCMVRSSTINVTLTSSFDDEPGSNTSRSGQKCGDVVVTRNTSDSNAGEFDWDKSTISEMLSIFYYGYIITQIPSGWLASRYGGKRIWGVSMLICSVCSLLTPLCARSHVYLVYAVRFILGLGAAVSFPCIQAMLGKWAPPFERSKLSSFILSGIPVGSITTFAFASLLCQYGFDNGWGSIFYLSGIINLLWVAAWFYLTADSPAQHKWISEREKIYIETSIGRGAIRKVHDVPWWNILTSLPVWAIVVGQVCNNYVHFSFITLLPTYLKESLNFDIKQNGLVSSSPYLSQFVSSLLVGVVADVVRERRCMSTTVTRRVFQSISFLGMALCMVSVGQLECEQRYIAVVLICLCTVFMSFNRGGYLVNHLDLAPSYAGILFAFTNTVGTVPGMVAPIIAGALTPNKTSEEWNHVFYVCAGLTTLGAVVYLFLSDGELQDWATESDGKSNSVQYSFSQDQETQAQFKQNEADETL
ncbi:sialin-like isoform X1 [Biomphalaria glabrata]|uniref:Sialin-like isoform X1 n=2 Tax=Biomphalaria glabrata TaxID=6526 RepID=A0A9W2YPN3_BIOGL|nr:sialin-like isoform X1 [Biomphalaria glabrata]